MIYLLVTSIFLLYIQPFHPDCELLPINLDMLRVEFVVSGFMVVLLVIRIFSGKYIIINKAQILFVSGLFVCVSLSHLSHFFLPEAFIEQVEMIKFKKYSSGLLEEESLLNKAFLAAISWFKYIFYYVVSVIVVDSRKKFKLFLGVHLVCILFLGFQGILQDHYDIHLAGQPMMVWGGDRITWVGSLADANQMAVNFVIAIPLFLAVMISKEGWSMWARIIAGGGALLMLYAIKLCNSRGGYIAALVALVMFCIVKSRTIGILLSLCGVLLFFSLAPGRMSNISSQEESAMGRIIAWSKGFDMVDAYPLFGVGDKMYLKYSIKVAHNAFIHHMAELGYIGLFFYIGIYYWSFKDAYSLYRNKGRLARDKLLDFSSGIIPSLCGMVTALCFLSETKATLFMWLGIPIIIGNIVRRDILKEDYEIS